MVTNLLKTGLVGQGHQVRGSRQDMASGVVRLGLFNRNRIVEISGALISGTHDLAALDSLLRCGITGAPAHCQTIDR